MPSWWIITLQRQMQTSKSLLLIIDCSILSNDVINLYVDLKHECKSINHANLYSASFTVSGWKYCRCILNVQAGKRCLGNKKALIAELMIRAFGTHY